MNAQEINDRILNATWPSQWIGPADDGLRDYGVHHFRRTFHIVRAPQKLVVHLSADNRYKFFVNGKQVSDGPARGDLANWYFETVDIAPYLKNGKNVLAALVWNMGVYAPIAQFSAETAFILQSDESSADSLNTNQRWKWKRSGAYRPTSLDNGARMRAYFAVGANDEMDFEAFDWGWETLDYNDASWKSPQTIAHGQPDGHGSDNRWTLKPRTIPPMEHTVQRLGKIVRQTGLTDIPLMPDGQNSVTISAGKKVTLLFDQGFNTIGYLKLNTSGGKGGMLKISYAESLFDENRQKGNRNEIKGKEMIGYYDLLHPSGSDQSFESLWIRTWRYLQLDIETNNEPLTISNIYGIFTAYPFEANATFKSSDPSLDKIWEVGLRTARLCAGETYFDCPYYEQLQYEGDTRIQELISLYVSGDDRLMRKAIMDFYQSRTYDGMPQGRYPSSRKQVIPPYSLIWISMIYDYWMHRPDTGFVKQFLYPVRGVLQWYEQRMNKQTGLAGALPWWNFVDYTARFPGGIPSGANEGRSSIISLGYLYALQHASELHRFFGEQHQATIYETRDEAMKKSIYKTFFNASRGLIADTPDQEVYSEHANALAVLTGVIPETDARELMERVIQAKDIIPTTFYFRFYLNKALKKAGLGDTYYSGLTPWRNMLEAGLTTFAETPDPTRSDCHAWSASPLYHFLETICGIEPAAPGFSQVKITPHLGGLQWVKAKMPHEFGEIEVSFQNIKGQLSGSILLPEKLFGILEYNGIKKKLLPGLNYLKQKEPELLKY